MPDITWEPYQRAESDPIRIASTSCCGAYELASQGGQYLVLRRSEQCGYEETGRGVYRDALTVWDNLVTEHNKGHPRHREPNTASRMMSSG